MDSREGYLYPLLVLGAFSVVALSIVGVVEILQYVPAKEPVRHERLAATGCGGCGVVEAVQRPGNAGTPLPTGAGADEKSAGRKNPGGNDGAAPADGESPSRYMVRLRMNDGSTELVYRSLKPAVGIGDRVKLIDGSMVALD